MRGQAGEGEGEEDVSRDGGMRLWKWEYGWPGSWGQE